MDGWVDGCMDGWIELYCLSLTEKAGTKPSKLQKRFRVHTDQSTISQQFTLIFTPLRVASWANPHVFGLCMEISTPWGNPCPQVWDQNLLAVRQKYIIVYLSLYKKGKENIISISPFLHGLITPNKNRTEVLSQHFRQLHAYNHISAFWHDQGPQKVEVVYFSL